MIDRAQAFPSDYYESSRALNVVSSAALKCIGDTSRIVQSWTGQTLTFATPRIFPACRPKLFNSKVTFSLSVCFHVAKMISCCDGLMIIVQNVPRPEACPLHVSTWSSSPIDCQWKSLCHHRSRPPGQPISGKSSGRNVDGSVDAACYSTPVFLTAPVTLANTRLIDALAKQLPSACKLWELLRLICGPAFQF